MKTRYSSVRMVERPRPLPHGPSRSAAQRIRVRHISDARGLGGLLARRREPRTR